MKKKTNPTFTLYHIYSSITKKNIKAIFSSRHSKIQNKIDK